LSGKSETEKSSKIYNTVVLKKERAIVKKNSLIFNIKKIILIAAAAAFTVSSAGCGDEPDDGSGYSFTCCLYNNPQNLDPQLATDKSSLMIIENMFTGLMAYNSEGNIDKGVAVDYIVSEDGLKYTFFLRDNCYWYTNGGTEFAVTAHDFVYAFKRIYDPVTRSPYREKFSFLKNAQDIIDGEADYTSLGVYAVSNTELVFYLDRPQADFLYLLTTAPAMPCNRQFFESTQARYGLDDESVISNGAFYMTQWSYDPYGNDNLIYMKRNYDNSQNDRVYPYMLTFLIERDTDEIDSNFSSSVTDCIVSDKEHNKALTDKYSSDSYEYSSAGLIFGDYCDDMPFEMKKALILNVDREGLKKITTPEYAPAYAVVPGSIKTGNKKYRDIKTGNELPFYESSYSLSSEDTDEFNISPEKHKILALADSDAGLLLKVAEGWQERLGVNIGVEYTDEDDYYERLESGGFYMAFTEITTDDNSLYYYLEKFISSINAERSVLDELDDMTLELAEGGAVSEKACSIENHVLSECCYIPLFYKKRFLGYRKNIEGLVFDPMTERVFFKYAKFYK